MTTRINTNIATRHEIACARKKYASDNLQIDDGAKASRCDSGLWIAAWVWLDYPERKPSKPPSADHMTETAA